MSRFLPAALAVTVLLSATVAYTAVTVRNAQVNAVELAESMHDSEQ